MALDIALGKLFMIMNEKPPGGTAGHEIWHKAVRNTKLWLDDRKTLPMRLLRAKAVRSARLVLDCVQLARDPNSARDGASCDSDVLAAFKNMYNEPTVEQRRGEQPFTAPTFPNLKGYITSTILHRLTLGKAERARENAEDATEAGAHPLVGADGAPQDADLLDRILINHNDADQTDAVPGEGSGRVNQLIPNQDTVCAPTITPTPTRMTMLLINCFVWRCYHCTGTWRFGDRTPGRPRSRERNRRGRRGPRRGHSRRAPE